MAKIERYTSEQPVPVEQAQLVDPAAFRFSAAGAKAWGQIGKVLSELGKRKIEMQDRIGISEINAAMENAEREYEKEIIGKPLDKHAAILIKHKNNAIAFASKQRLTSDARKLAMSKLQIWGDTFSDVGEIATIKAIERDAIIRVITDYEKALTEGDAEAVVEAEAVLDAQFKNSYEPGEAEKLKIEAEKRAIKQMESNAVNAVHDAIEVASNLKTGTGNFERAKELAKSPSIDGLTKTRLRSAIKTAENARISIVKEELEVQREGDRDAISKAIQNADPNIGGIIDRSKLDEKEQWTWSERARINAERLAKGKPSIFDESDPEIEAMVSTAISFHPDMVSKKDIRFYLGKGKKGGLSLAKVEKYEQLLGQAMDAASPLNTIVAKNYVRMLKEAETDRVFSLDKVKNSIIYGQKNDALMDFFVAYKETTGKDVPAQDAQAFYDDLVSAYRKPESPFTEAKVQQMLGELQSGGAVSIFGVVMPFTSAEDAINHALRTLGPDWQKISPDASRIIKGKFPEAKLDVLPPKPKTEFQIGQRFVHPNGGTYEYTGESGDKAWRLVKE